MQKLKKENRDVLFFDESRFGIHSKVGPGCFSKGKRTAVKLKLGFQNFYIYGAVSSKVIRNKIYNTIGDLEAAVCHFIQNISNEGIMNNCACNYL